MLGIEQVFDELQVTVPVAVSGTIESTGTMLAGQAVEALYASLMHWPLLYLGLNCATGPEFMTDHIRSLAALSHFPVFAVPNAGLPDEDGNYLEGSCSYKLTLKAHVPAANFWSLILYEGKSSSGLKESQPYPPISSFNKLEYDKDGSIALYFGPALPVGVPECNYLKTVSGQCWFSQLRLYSPTQAFYEQTWKPGEFEKISYANAD